MHIKQEELVAGEKGCILQPSQVTAIHPQYRSATDHQFLRLTFL